MVQQHIIQKLSSVPGPISRHVRNHMFEGESKLFVVWISWHLSCFRIPRLDVYVSQDDILNVIVIKTLCDSHRAALGKQSVIDMILYGVLLTKEGSNQQPHLQQCNLKFVFVNLVDGRYSPLIRKTIDILYFNRFVMGPNPCRSFAGCQSGS